jgi:hypothetical protein
VNFKKIPAEQRMWDLWKSYFREVIKDIEGENKTVGVGPE